MALQIENLNFKVIHVGINQDNDKQALETAKKLENLFGFTTYDKGGSYFAGSNIEILKENFLGTKGHIAIQTGDIEKAKDYLESKKVYFNKESANYDANGNLKTIYLRDEIAGFAIHLIQK